MVIVWGDGHVNKTYFNDSYTISTCIKSFSLGYLKFTQRMYPLNWSKKIGSTETVGLEWVNKTFQARVFNFTIYLNYLGEGREWGSYILREMAENFSQNFEKT